MIERQAQVVHHTCQQRRKAHRASEPFLLLTTHEPTQRPPPLRLSVMASPLVGRRARSNFPPCDRSTRRPSVYLPSSKAPICGTYAAKRSYPDDSMHTPSPVRGCVNDSRQACSISGACSAPRRPYSISPTTGKPLDARCTRIWCLRPVPSVTRSSEWPPSGLTARRST